MNIAAVRRRLNEDPDWTRTKPCVAFMGEFSAGKSTVINLIAGREVVATKVTATQLPPVWISHGPVRSARTLGLDGTVRNLADPTLRAEDLKEQALIRLTVDCPLLEEFDVFDTPGTSDPNYDCKTLELVAELSQLVVWCTHATQAWRQTEQAFWSSLPVRLRAHSLLLITRADKLRSQTDVGKVRRRLDREAGDLFREILFIASPRAARARALRGTEAGDLEWVTSGGADLVKELSRSLALAGQPAPVPFRPTLEIVASRLAAAGEAGPLENGSTPDPVTEAAPGSPQAEPAQHATAQDPVPEKQELPAPRDIVRDHLAEFPDAPQGAAPLPLETPVAATDSAAAQPDAPSSAWLPEQTAPENREPPVDPDAEPTMALAPDDSEPADPAQADASPSDLPSVADPQTDDGDAAPAGDVEPLTAQDSDAGMPGPQAPDRPAPEGGQDEEEPAAAFGPSDMEDVFFEWKSPEERAALARAGHANLDPLPPEDPLAAEDGPSAFPSAMAEQDGPKAAEMTDGAASQPAPDSETESEEADGERTASGDANGKDALPQGLSFSSSDALHDALFASLTADGIDPDQARRLVAGLIATIPHAQDGR